MWPFRAAAFRRRARTIASDVRSSDLLGGCRPDHRNGINAATAVCTWHSVSPGSSPPELLPHPGQEQGAHAAHDQVTVQPLVPPAFVLTQPDLGLLVLEAALDVPAMMPSKSEVGWPGSG
jgi:hypothetical protein